MQSQIQVGVDIGGSSTKISVRPQNSNKFSPIQKIQNGQLYSDKKKCGQRLASAILKVTNKYFPGDQISMIAISMSGNIDHQKNVVTLSYLLQRYESTGHKYGEFGLAYFVRKQLQKMVNKKIRVTLLHDRIAASVDPVYKDRLVLTFTLGTFPVLGLSEKSSQNKFKVYDNYIGNWVDTIYLSNGKNITQSLNSTNNDKRIPKQNCKLIIEAMIKILAKYKQVFKFQPNCMVILGGWAHVLKLQEKFPSELDHIKIIPLLDHTQSVHSQMNGAIEYAKNHKKYSFV